MNEQGNFIMTLSQSSLGSWKRTASIVPMHINFDHSMAVQFAAIRSWKHLTDLLFISLRKCRPTQN